MVSHPRTRSDELRETLLVLGEASSRSFRRLLVLILMMKIIPLALLVVMVVAWNLVAVVNRPVLTIHAVASPAEVSKLDSLPKETSHQNASLAPHPVLAHSNSACSSTVRVAASCLSGG